MYMYIIPWYCIKMIIIIMCKRRKRTARVESIAKQCQSSVVTHLFLPCFQGVVKVHFSCWRFLFLTLCNGFATPAVCKWNIHQYIYIIIILYKVYAIESFWRVRSPVSHKKREYILTIFFLCNSMSIYDVVI